MAVSSRNIAALGSLALTVLSLGLPAAAGCGTGCTGSPALPGTGPAMPGLQLPVPPSIGLPPSGRPGPSCCGSVPSIPVPGATLARPDATFGGGAVAGWDGAGLLSFPTSQASQSAASRFAVSGGGYSESVAAPQSRLRLNVQTDPDTVSETVPVTEQVCAAPAVEQGLRVIDAVCIDAAGDRTPAQRLAPGDQLLAGHTGEVFRCLIGAKMEARIGPVTGAGASPSQGAEILSCRVGETVSHQSDGRFACAPLPADCNCSDSTVVKVYGPGAKRLDALPAMPACIPVSRTVMKTESRTVERERIVPGQPMILTGGVGSGVN